MNDSYVMLIIVAGSIIFVSICVRLLEKNETEESTKYITDDIPNTTKYSV